jgi:bile acid-coenzyme A ligase
MVAVVSMVEAFRRWAQDVPDQPALTVDHETLTFRHLELRSQRLAHTLLGLGVEAGDVVCIALPNSVEFVETALAVLKVGATMLPVSNRLPQAERQAIIELADPRLVVGVQPADHPGRSCVPQVPEPSLSDMAQPLGVRISPAWRATTSGGSTGRPKLIRSTVPATIDDEAAPEYLLPSREVVLVPGPLYHTAPCGITMLGLVHGNHVVLQRRFDAEHTLALVARFRPTFLLLVPTMMHRIIRLPDDVRDVDMSSLKTVFHMAAPCPAWLKQAWIDWLGPERIYELYGASDSPGYTIISGTEWLEHQGSVGRPEAGLVMITTEDGDPVAPGVVGEIWMRPPTGRPMRAAVVGSEARQRFGWTSVGDLGWLDDAGYLYIADRRTDMVLTGGENVYTAEVEAALDSHPCVRSSVVVGLADDDLGQKVHAIVEVDPGTTEDSLRAHMEQRLARYKTPRSYELVDHPLRDDAGKVRKSALTAAHRPTFGTELIR